MACFPFTQVASHSGETDMKAKESHASRSTFRSNLQIASELHYDLWPEAREAMEKRDCDEDEMRGLRKQWGDLGSPGHTMVVVARVCVRILVVKGNSTR
jgi:hypothetical protein